MNPYIMQTMADEHNCDLRRQAVVARRARLARRIRARRGGMAVRRSES